MELILCRTTRARRAVIVNVDPRSPISQVADEMLADRPLALTLFVRTMLNPENRLSFNISICNRQRKGFGLRTNVVRDMCNSEGWPALHIYIRNMAFSAVSSDYNIW
ncbi:MAG: hypothetical protein JRJ47_08730 [Deltaproteobacteria bacterium]|nr:hypothetical protein [Deltaproteobacteria bacterium]